MLRELLTPMKIFSTEGMTQVFGLLEKGAIHEVGLVQGQYVSSYFAVPKSKRVSDKLRLVLNLKNSTNMFVMFISVWKTLKWSGNGSRKAPCVCGVGSQGFLSY